LKSNILKDSKELKELNKILPEAKSMKLVYAASKDGWTASQFHTKCNEMGNLLFLAKTS